MPVLRFPSVLAPPGPCGWAMWLRPTAWPNHTCPCGSLITGAGWWCCGFRHPSVHVALGPPPASVRRAFPRTDGSDCPQLLLSGPRPQVPLVDDARARRCHSGGEAPRLLRCCSRLRGPSPLRHRRKASLAAELAVQGRCDVGARRARRLVILLVRCPIRRRWPSNQWRLSS